MPSTAKPRGPAAKPRDQAAPPPGRQTKTATASKRSTGIGRLLRVRDWRVRSKLTAVLVIPVLAFLAVAGTQISGSISTTMALDRFTEQMASGHETAELIHQLQTERDHSVGLLATTERSIQRQSLISALTADRQAVDRSAAAFDHAIRQVGSDPQTAAAYATVRTDLDAVRRTRDGVSGGWLRQRAVFEQYSKTISDLASVLPTNAGPATTADLSSQIRTFAATMALVEYKAQLRGTLFAAAITGTFAIDDFDTLTDLRGRQRASATQLRSGATSAELARFDEITRSPEAGATARLLTTAVDRSRSLAVGVDPAEWWLASTAELNLLHTFESTGLNDIVANARDMTGAQRANSVAVTGTIVLVVTVAGLLCWTVGRSMVRSLVLLRTHALDVAAKRLPAAIGRLRTADSGAVSADMAAQVGTVHVGDDEIGEVSEAFAAVHNSALHLAAEQAAMRHAVNRMFVNLSRRSQALVERQLGLLDTLEVAETDPDQLGSLFRLDHLATRMRRNNENLLVLAGAEASRRWRDPVPMSAVLLAAMAEIEEYERVGHDVTDRVFVVGHVVADLVHLLAELLENATTFSPPDCQVTIVGSVEGDGRPEPTGAPGPRPPGSSWDQLGATIVIDDEGIGMTADGLTEANNRIHQPSSIDVAASERMGLVVVGHLAARHGIRVRLTVRTGPDGGTEGISARVDLPRSLLAEVDGEADLGYGAAGQPSGVLRRPIVAAAARIGQSRQPAQQAISAHGSLRPITPAPANPTQANPAPTVPAQVARGSAAVTGRGAVPASGAIANGAAVPAAGTVAPVGSRPTAGNLPAAPGEPQHRPDRNSLPRRTPGGGSANDGGASITDAWKTVEAIPQDPDPNEVSSVLHAFYDGVRRGSQEPLEHRKPPFDGQEQSEC